MFERTPVRLADSGETDHHRCLAGGGLGRLLPVPPFPKRKSRDRYFPEGIDLPGIDMIREDTKAIRYWDGSDEGPIAV